MAKKISFTIVNRPIDASQTRAKIESDLVSQLQKQMKGTKGATEVIPPALMDALVSASTHRSRGVTVQKGRASQSSSANALPADVVNAVKRISLQEKKVTTIGILDMGAWVSRLPNLLQTLNKAQSQYTFLEVQTAVPAGLIKTEKPLIAWAERAAGRELKAKEKKDIERNMLADEFFYFADSVRKQHKLDYMFGLTPAMIAFEGEDGDGPRWNYFAWGRDNVSVLSTYDLRGYAEEAGRPYEAAVGMLIVTQAIVKRTPLKRHTDTHQCVFDFNADRNGLVESIKKMHIHKDCMTTLEHFDADEAAVAKALIRAISRMKGSTRD